MGILKRILGPRSNPPCDYPDTLKAMARRLEFLRSGTNKRFWWHQMEGHDYLPPIFSFLDDREWKIMESWFEDTEKRVYIGECNIPMMSMLQGLIMGNAIDAIVECGHFAGYSTLLMGFMLRKMGKQHGLFSIDINETISKYTQGWIDKAGLHDYVLMVEGDSTDPKMPDLAREALSSEIKLVFIDSSHEYANTLKELDLWYEAVVSQGLVILHDTSHVSAGLDPTEEGGVKRGLYEWTTKHSSTSININEDPFPDGTLTTPVYKDVCGLGIIQKAGPAAIEARIGA